MKKVYTKPNMKIVSFTTENIATDGTSSITATQTYQTKSNMNTINY